MPTPSQAGVYDLTFTATDGGSSSGATAASPAFVERFGERVVLLFVAGAHVVYVGLDSVTGRHLQHPPRSRIEAA